MTLPTRHAAQASATQPPRLRHICVHRDPFAYCSHPSIVCLPSGEWIIAFMESMRRPTVLHSPSDPRFYAVLSRSHDEGETWSPPYVVPNYDWYGVECPSVTARTNGDLVLFQWRWRWAPLDVERAPHRVVGLYERAGHAWARGNNGAYAHRSRDGGHSWEIGSRIGTAPYSGAYSMRAAAELADGTLLLPVTDIPQWRQIYLLRSSDDGRTWRIGPRIAGDTTHQFSEPCILRFGSTLIVLIREVTTGLLYQSDSMDGGEHWSAPQQTPMWGCPPHLLALADGRVLCVYGYRRRPYGIRGCLSADGGQTWEIDREVVLHDLLRRRRGRSDLHPGDLFHGVTTR
ncbi:MAG: glycoside hydrolase [Thermomicrobia bacterium]|nr:glycoside hydrolase [Thermomicrobia bacterium]